jgi:putative membrane protein
MTSAPDQRRPRAFSLDDPTVVAPVPAPEPEAALSSAEGPPPQTSTAWSLPTRDDIAGGFRWGQLLLTTAFGLAMLAAGLWFTRFVSVALARDDLLGWIAWSLAMAMAVAASVLVLRELIGLLRLARLGGLRRDVDRALADRDLELERRAVGKLSGILADRPELRWGKSRLGERGPDVRDPGDLIRLAERELVAPLDAAARRLILKSAKRVSMVTAISPMVWIAMLYVLVENLRMLRGLAALYGGRPGVIGGLKLGRLVVSHIIASGGIALTEDLVGQFLGQDLLRRVSRRLGEGAFNGTLTARVGVATIEVIRPLPYLDARPVRLRDLVGELLKRTKAA